MEINSKKKLILITAVLLEIVIGSIFLFRFYKKRTTPQLPAPDKIAAISKENLIFPENSEFQYYYEAQPDTVITDSPDWLGYVATYTYNADGLNDRFDYTIEKPADTFRIITLGDSFTFGHYVNTEDSWPERLEDLLNKNKMALPCGLQKIEVINLGMAGWDIPYIVKRYQDIGAKYNPDLIVWFESGSGFIRLNELLSPIINDYADQCMSDSSNTRDENNKLYYCHLEGWKRAEKQIAEKYSYQEIEQILDSRLDDFFSAIDQEKVLFFTFEKIKLKEDWQNTLKHWQARYPKVHFLSIVPDINFLKKVLPDGHPNKQGHQTIALSIYEYLENNVIKQCE